MFFIGVISDEENFEIIRENIHRKINKIKNKKFDIINIKKENIENFKNIKFNSLIVHNDSNALCLDKLNSDSLEKIFSNIDYLLLNSDEKIDLSYITKDITKSFLKVITYGINHMATITISSINKKNVLIAIQRIIENIYEEKVEEMEYMVTNNEEITIENILVIESFMMIYQKSN